MRPISNIQNMFRSRLILDSINILNIKNIDGCIAFANGILIFPNRIRLSLFRIRGRQEASPLLHTQKALRNILNYFSIVNLNRLVFNVYNILR